MNAVLSVQGSAVPEKTKPSFMSRVFNKKKALKAAKVALPVAAVAAFFPDAAMATTTATDLMKSGDATVKGTFGKRRQMGGSGRSCRRRHHVHDDQKREVPVWLRDYFHLYHHRYVGRRLLTGST